MTQATVGRNVPKLELCSDHHSSAFQGMSTARRMVLLDGQYQCKHCLNDSVPSLIMPIIHGTSCCVHRCSEMEKLGAPEHKATRTGQSMSPSVRSVQLGLNRLRYLSAPTPANSEGSLSHHTELAPSAQKAWQLTP